MGSGEGSAWPIEVRAVRGRPLLLAALYLMAGILAGTVLPQARWWALGVVALLTVLCFVHFARRRSPLLPAMALAFAAGVALLGFALPAWADDPWQPAGAGEVRGRVVGVGWTAAGHARYTLDRVTVDGTAVEGRVALTASDDAAEARQGDGLVVQAGLQRPAVSRFFGDFNARGYYLRQGVRFVATNTQPVVEQTSDVGWRAWVDDARAYARQVLRRNLRLDTAGIVDALLSGSKNGISDEGRNAFGALGLAHLLAVSGLNVSLTAGAAWLLCRRLRLPLPVSLAVSLLVLAAYVLFAGPAPSLLRAAVMWLVAMGALVAARRYDPLTSLAAAVMLLLCLNPLDLFDAGFQLSFAATAAIVLWGVPAQQALPPQPLLQGVAGALGITVVVQLLALPMVLWYFNGVSLLSPVANLLLVPSSFLLQLGGMALVAVGWLAEPAARVGSLVDWYGQQYLGAVQGLARTPLTLAATTPPLWLQGLYAALVLALSPAVVRMGRLLRWVAMGLLAVLVVVQFSPLPAVMAEPGEGVLLHEGGAHVSMVWQDADGYHVVCGDRWDAAADYLAKRGVTRLTSLCLLDRKPLMTLLPFTGNGSVDIGCIYVPDDWLTGQNGLVLGEMVAGSLTLTPVSQSPWSWQQWDGGAALTVAVDGWTVRYVPYALKRGEKPIRASMVAGEVVVLNVPGDRARALADGAPATVVTAADLAEGQGAVYNVEKAGSIALDERDGVVRLTPWRGGWADGLSGNFR